jgi:hypothetical protein
MRKEWMESVSFQFLLVNRAFTGMVSRVVDATWGSLVPILLAVNNRFAIALNQRLCHKIDMRSLSL